MIYVDTNPLEVALTVLNKLFPEIDVEIQIFPENIYRTLNEEYIEKKMIPHHLPSLVLFSGTKNIVVLNAGDTFEEMMENLFKQFAALATASPTKEIREEEFNKALEKIYVEVQKILRDVKPSKAQSLFLPTELQSVTKN
jgi:hypothetical protein